MDGPEGSDLISEGSNNPLIQFQNLSIGPEKAPPIIKTKKIMIAIGMIVSNIVFSAII